MATKVTAVTLVVPYQCLNHEVTPCHYIFNRGSNTEARNVDRYPGKSIITIIAKENWLSLNFLPECISAVRQEEA